MTDKEKADPQADPKETQLDNTSGHAHAIVALSAYIRSAGYDLSLSAELAKAGGEQ